MRKRPNAQLDLFLWAESRPTADIINAVERFEFRRMAFGAQSVLELFVPPPVTGGLTNLNEYRASVGGLKGLRRQAGRRAS